MVRETWGPEKTTAGPRNTWGSDDNDGATETWGSNEDEGTTTGPRET